jgi:RNA polymerase sigma-70 factor, ECF subfamily
MFVPPAADDSQEAVFKRWLKEHTGLVFKIARAFAPGDADRDDLVQEILLQLWRSLPRFEGKAKESTWIYRVALNTALAWHRGEKKPRMTDCSRWRNLSRSLSYTHSWAGSFIG